MEVLSSIGLCVLATAVGTLAVCGALWLFGNCVPGFVACLVAGGFGSLLWAAGGLA